jgi:hypothetical protein
MRQVIENCTWNWTIFVKFLLSKFFNLAQENTKHWIPKPQITRFCRTPLPLSVPSTNFSPPNFNDFHTLLLLATKNKNLLGGETVYELNENVWAWLNVILLDFSTRIFGLAWEINIGAIALVTYSKYGFLTNYPPLANQMRRMYLISQSNAC